MLRLEYARVVNMLRLHRVLRELYFKCSRLFWMSWVLKILKFWMYQESKYATVTKGSNKILHRIYLTGFWIYHGFKFIQKTLHHRCLTGSECSSGSKYTRILNMSGLHKLLKKCCITDAWQDAKYSSSYKYDRVLNMSRLHMILNKRLHYRYSIGF